MGGSEPGVAPRTVLDAILDGLDGRTVTVGVASAPPSAGGSDQELAERVAKVLNRKGGPKLRPHVIGS